MPHLNSIAKYSHTVSAQPGSDTMVMTTTTAVRVDREVICLAIIALSLSYSNQTNKIYYNMYEQF